MGKKSQKFSRFIASANSVNYRNDAIIVENLMKVLVSINDL